MFRPVAEQTKTWFTVDDGETYFADNVSNIPPFVKNGKTAYGCEVFSCDGGKSRFVGFLVRYRAGAAAEFKTLGPPPQLNSVGAQDYYDRRGAIELRTREVKRPLTGDAGWTLARSSPEGPAITHVKCPDGNGVVESALP